MQYFYYVWVRSNRYHGSEPLTYSSPSRLTNGAIVQVFLQHTLVMGVVVGSAQRPRFKTKPISRVYDLPPIPAYLLSLSAWIQGYYPAPIGMLTQQIIPASLSEKQLAIQATPLDPPAPAIADLPPLSEEQQQALLSINAPDTYLIHGKTGSGKTRLYIELSLRAVENGKSAIILTPEISLTSQLAHNFKQVFGERVIVLHSQQAPSERQHAWLRILHARQPVIVIGPRSALFCPLKSIGLIVLDESHEASYKQEQAPQYLTTRVASYLRSLTRATLILGSATPSVSDYFIALQKQKPIIRLTKLARTDAEIPTKVSIIDMRQRELFSKSSLLSQPLLTAMEEALRHKNQSLLYLNRRGTARLVMCEKCGWQANCPHCDLPLTYHSDSHQLRCYSCNYHSYVITNCPSCSHPSILFKTAGTKAIVEEVTKLFPRARVARFDTDNTKAERFEQHYEAVQRGDIDILIGTQLLAKGLDLPKLSTLGIVLADTSLYVPDYSATERTYQLISQVLGRIGRGHVAGQAFIQTYHPEHEVLQTAIGQDYETFYSAELASRKTYFFPPFCHILKLSCRRVSAKSAELATQKFKDLLLTTVPSIIVEGPAPSFHEHFERKYQWQLVVKATNRTSLLAVLKILPANWSSDIDPVDLL